ncbi:MAG: hypothetical protein SF097_06665 [Acidobacteriota bacterium]|nr:hypothetical protein [Acidobacteriota bacterium]
MLSVLYLAGMVYFGDCLCRCFYRYKSIQHRLATAFLVGLLVSSIITYLGALAFARTAQPMVWGNVIFAVAVGLAALKTLRCPPLNDDDNSRPAGNDKWDWLCLFSCFVFSSWLMWVTLDFPNGDFQFGFKSWSDFGANLSVSQSFVLGHNFPSTHPFFPGEQLRYHFLFWFQAANLAFLGMSLVSSVNFLSILSMLALVILVMTFAEQVFASRAVARISAILFFFTSSALSYIPFLRTQPGISQAVKSIWNATQFVHSGYAYRGEDWGALTVGIFANQRHLSSAIGILFIALIFLVDCYQRASSAHSDVGQVQNLSRPIKKYTLANSYKPLLFSGALIGLLPYWNSAVFVSAFIVLGGLWLFFPIRTYLLFLIGMAILVGLPQVLMLRAGTLTQTGHSLFHWGYTIPEPTLWLVVKYLAWTFGLKWLLIGVALWLLTNAQRRLFLALFSLVVVVFTLQLSTDVFNNHKLLNIWTIFATIFASYALWRIGKGGFLRVGLALVLALAMSFGAILDLFPLQNDSVITIPHQNDRLTNWIFQNTHPSDVFLTHSFLAHPILFSGRKLFLGYTLFAWTAGYNVGQREAVYKQIFKERNRDELIRLLKQNKIAYVGIDNDLKGNSLIKEFFDESIFQQNFQKVFEDTENRYASLTIYKVPDQ